MDKILVYLQSRLTITAVLEILIITFCIYKILMWIRGTQAEQVAKGVLLLIVLVPLSNWLGFTTLNYLFNNLVTWIIIIIVVVFQPELRSALENLGNRNIIFKLFNKKKTYSQMREDVHQILFAVQDLAREKIGALIVCEGQTGLKDIVNTGISLDAKISSEILENIFTPNRPLHDGAVVVNLQSGKILGAGCLLPLTEKSELDTDLGTRHRAGIGISEKCDALTIIVSEESGTISCTERGVLTRDLRGADLEKMLLDRFAEPEDERNMVRRAMHPRKQGEEQQ